ncbi:MAG: gluconolactonase [Gemmatimonadetes bacterium]|nr:gluconolactonase [Gemmatimonadota bacterium]
MDWEFERVAGPFDFTEGPVWMGDHLLFTDIPNSCIMRYDPNTGACDEFRTGTNRANGLTLGNDGQLYACEGGASSLGDHDADAQDGRRITLYVDGQDAKVLADQFEGSRLNSPNDIVVDASGRIWFTDPRYGARDDMELDHESVFRLDPDGKGGYGIVRVTFDTTRPNGLLVSSDGRSLYVAQSDPGPDVKRELRRYPIQDDGSVGEYEIPHNFYPHRGIDGMRFDEDGNIVASAGWTQSGPGPMIYVLSPEGRVLDTNPIEINPTNCCFGDEDLQTLYVTASDGSLFRARTDRKGMVVGQV